MSALQPLSNDAILGRAPSVFAEQAAPGASSKYQFVRTIEVIEHMRKSGFEVTQASQSKARNAEGRNYTKHVVRLVHSDYMTGASRVGDVIPQVVMTNSHDRTAAYQLACGLFRLACLNGMMTVTAEFRSVRVLHNDPEIQQHIIDGTNIIRQIGETVALPTIGKMRELELSPAQTHEFAQAATYLKFGEVRPDHALEFLTARRGEDEGRTLWSVLNRVQENAVRGGYTARDRAGRNVKVRGIESVDRDLDFNANLWTLGARVLDMAATA